MNAHSSINPNSPKLKTTQMFIHWWVQKWCDILHNKTVFLQSRGTKYCHQQRGWTSKTSYPVKEARHKTLHLPLTLAVVHSLNHVWLFASPWKAARQASLSFTISWSWLTLMSIELVVLSNHLILCRTLLLLPSIFPCITVYSNEPALLLILSDPKASL